MKTKAYHQLLTIVCLLLVVLTSCSKSDDPQPQITDPNDIIAGTYTMSYLASGSDQYTLPVTDGGATVSGQVVFSRISNTSTSLKMVLTITGSTTASSEQNVVVYIKLLNQTTVGLYNGANMTTQIGTGTKNLIDFKGVDSNGKAVAMKATR